MSASAAALAAAVLLLRQDASSAVSRADAARDRAIASLHRRAAAAAPGTEEGRRVAAELGAFGSADLRDGRIGSATELLAEAYALDGDNGLLLAELTLAHVRGEDFDGARFYLRLAEQRITRAPPEIYAVLGQVYYALNRLDDAIAAWGEAVRFGGQDPPMLRSLARARDELALTHGQRTRSRENFSIFADPAIPEEILESVGTVLEAAYREESALLGERLSGPQVVVLYAGRSYFALASVPDWVSGFYDGKIRISIEPDERPDYVLAGVLAHELAHALIRRRSGGRAPAWLQEGLAQWCEGRRLARREIADALTRKTGLSLEALDASFGRTLDRAAARASYAQALSLVEYLMQSSGPGAISCLAARLGEGASLAEALRTETGHDPSQLLAGWRRWAGLSRPEAGTARRGGRATQFEAVAGAGVGPAAAGSPRKAIHAGSVAMVR